MPGEIKTCKRSNDWLLIGRISRFEIPKIKVQSSEIINFVYVQCAWVAAKGYVKGGDRIEGS
jgi:hypothetical protein